LRRFGTGVAPPVPPTATPRRNWTPRQGRVRPLVGCFAFPNVAELHRSHRALLAQTLPSESLSLRERVAAAGRGFGQSEAQRCCRTLNPSPEGKELHATCYVVESGSRPSAVA
jgi:hypothetical protein